MIWAGGRKAPMNDSSRCALTISHMTCSMPQWEDSVPLKIGALENSGFCEAVSSESMEWALS